MSHSSKGEEAEKEKMPYPEHERQRAILEQANTIGDFLEWYGGQGWHRMRWREDLTDEVPCTGVSILTGRCRGDSCAKCGGTGYETIKRKAWVNDERGVEQLLAEYFSIDLTKIEAEKRDMLDALRAAAGGPA